MNAEILYPNELLRQGDTACEYDLDGNLVRKHSPQLDTSFTYDALNRLTCVEITNERVQFVYDPMGRCLKKLISKKEKGNWKEVDAENYLYDGQREIGAFKGDKTLKQLKVTGFEPYENFALPVSLELEGNLYVPLNDPQGNVRLLLNPKDKKVGAEYDFSAFGATIKAMEKTPFNPWRYSGKRLDPELRLVSFGKRYYDPELARWLNLDPAGFVDGVNLYQYVYNNPNASMDPDGRFVVLMLPLFSAVFGGAGLTFILPSVTTTLTCLAIGGVGLISYKIAEPSDRKAISSYGLMYMEAVDEEVVGKKKKERRVKQENHLLS
ncbi:MAG: RHS repeat-associated core domain-containing protein [Parachlamydiaceae bacterium]|nr:RHS repeat-associated core domain-containing protein [Parachlamydiaceae bacterium]